MQEQFEVIEIKNEAMKLKVNRSGGCSSCGANGACGTGVLSKYFDGFSIFNRPLRQGVKVGDFVVLEISPKELFYRAFQLYILPLLALFASGVVGGFYFPENELWQIGMGFFGFFATLLLLKYFTK